MKDSKNLIIGMLCAVVCVMAVAYAAFQTTLTINGTATISSTWNVAITAIDCNATAVEGGQAAAVTKSFTATTAQFDFTFNQPGDTGHCDVTISNTGSLDAKVKSIDTVVKDGSGASKTVTADDNSLDVTAADLIKYNLSGIATGDTLAAGKTQTYKIDAAYDADATGSATEATKTKTVTVTIGYEQKLG